ncbi:MAG: hypothetical protein P8Y45_06725 [Exilibacterium sp.]
MAAITILRAFCLACIGSGLLTGCSIVDIRNSIVYEGGRGPVSEQLLSRIRPGYTSSEWLRQYLGEPQRINAAQGDDTQTWVYQFEEQHSSRFRILLLFQYRDKKSFQRQLRLSMRQGIVHSVWTDFEYPAEGAGENTFVENNGTQTRGESSAADKLSPAIDPFSEDVIQE